MRAVDCPCGEHLEGTNDSQVLEAMRKHASEEHEGKYSETELRLLIDTSAYDAGSS